MAAGSSLRWAAGVLPVSLDGSTPVVLLGRDCRAKGGGWSDFAGGRETCDDSPAETALRELAEETGGAVAVTDSQMADALVFTDLTPSGNPIYRFVVTVPFDAAIPSRFRGSKDDEKVALRWFPLAALPRMRRVFAEQMKRDVSSIVKHVLLHSKKYSD